MEQIRPFTGRPRRRTTAKGVVMADIAAKGLISFGGIATIVAVLGVCLFLVWVALPLFQAAKIGEPAIVADRFGAAAPIHAAVDEHRSLAWIAFPRGRLQVVRLDTGAVLAEKQLGGGRQITCASFLASGPETVLGSADGSIEVLKIRFESTFPGEELPQAAAGELGSKAEGRLATWGDGVVQITPEGQLRRQRLVVEEVATAAVSGGPVLLAGHVVRPDGLLICALAGAGEDLELKALSGGEKEDFLSGETALSFSEPVKLPFEALSPEPPKHLAVAAGGRDVYVAWEDGQVLRVSLSRGLGRAFIAEKGRLTEPDVALTAAGFVLGDTTLVFGDAKGRVRGGFQLPLAQLASAGMQDAVRDTERASSGLAVNKELVDSDSTVTALAASSRSRLLLCGFANGEVALVNATTEAVLGTAAVPSGRPVIALAFAPKDDGLLAVTPAEAYFCTLDARHPEASFGALFLPVQYEGYARPQHMWQSSSGSDDTEPKLGLMPLVFGSIKATLYAMLFGTPLALLAAVCSSEFLRPRAKAAIKPTIELMASLPSVVLGFLAALVFAPVVERVVPAVLLLFATVPFALLLGARLWQFLPAGFTRRLAAWRPLFLIVPAAGGVLLALALGPLVEGLFFGGDFKGWLAAGPGRAGAERFAAAAGGWLILCLPAAALAAGYLSAVAVTPWMRRFCADRGRRAIAALDCARFAAGAAFTVGLALAAAAALDALGLDLRGTWLLGPVDVSPMDTYVQRNALIVGFVMGFAIIPIIYTLADDALASVPDHLRSASLGSGATTWQTAVRVVIPTAMSGLFSSLMIGLGRAVGETMIVLMALGNTPIMDLNLFNGARTLSANIAVELPEAARNSTHYRTLFLAALVLFAMTFIINTVAEAVRLRFRKRAVQL